MEKQNTKTLFAYLAVCLFWGSTYIAIRIGVKDLPPLLFTSMRFLIAGIAVAVFAKARGLSFPNNIKETAKISLAGGIMLMGGTGFLVTAEQWVASGTTSIIVASIPLIMAFIEFVFLRKRNLGVLGVAGLFVGFGGVVFLSIGKGGVGEASMKGILFLLAAGTFWSVGSLYSQTIKPKCSIVVSIAIQMLSGGLGLLILGLVLGEAGSVSFTTDSLLALIYLTIFGSIIGYGCYIYILQHWPASRASTYAYVNPVVAVILGAVILHEQISYKVVCSLVIILAGVMLVQKSKNLRLRQPKA